MRFLIDMNLSPLWVQFLAEKGFHESTGQPSVNQARLILRSSNLRRQTTGSYSRTIWIGRRIFEI
jgi:hypothetical protein